MKTYEIFLVGPRGALFQFFIGADTVDEATRMAREMYPSPNIDIEVIEVPDYAGPQESPPPFD